jgi:hypothetical protein
LFRPDTPGGANTNYQLRPNTPGGANTNYQFHPPGGANIDLVVRQPNAGHHHHANISILNLRKPNHLTTYLMVII